MDLTRSTRARFNAYRPRPCVLGGLLVAAVVLSSLTTAQAQDRFITIASTTSTENSGLFTYLLPMFRQATGIQARVIAQGTGQALDTGTRGDADVVFVHDRTKELALVKGGWFVERREVMYNDFVLVGPRSDPAKVAGGRDIVTAVKRIQAAKAPFASRGDRSGTHSAELRLWKAAGLEMPGAKGPWYRETGSGMGATLNTASGMNAYALADRGTWLSFKNRGELIIVVEGDQRLFNQYGVMLVNPAKHPHTKTAEAMAFIDWVTSPEGQQAIADFRIDGEQLFFPNYRKEGGPPPSARTTPTRASAPSSSRLDARNTPARTVVPHETPSAAARGWEASPPSPAATSVGPGARGAP